ncbi:MAG TPA: nitrous oxide reductase accessory protein NosL [Azoarcus taiwanensis]|nr:nitrous oxide reductase accessory protein NosL [Azoarcus taiwanensis]
MKRLHAVLLPLLALGALLLVACDRQTGFDERAEAVALTDETLCFYTGLRLSDFGGPKAQLHFAGETPRFYADTVKMFHVLLNPGTRPGSVRAAFVQDMSDSDWYAPGDRWIDARGAWYVQGSALIGPLGPTLAAFSSQAAAERFAAEHGGTTLRFADVNADMVIIDGGALHDTSM